eukprot:s1636_g4.t1
MKRSRKVVFGPTVHVFVGSANDLMMTEFEFPFDQLGQWTAKPWSIRRAMPLAVEEPLPSTVLSPTTSLLDPSQSKLVPESNSSDTSNDSDSSGIQPLAMEAVPESSGLSDQPASRSSASYGFLAPASRDNAIYDMARSWFLELQSTWREFAKKEFEDESRVLYIETWYLHHQHRPRCDSSRTVRLDNLDHHWLDDIRRVWIDVLRAGEPLHLTYVAPLPPRADSQQCMAHLILSQGHVPDHVGAVLTARLLEDHQTHLIQAAVSVPDWMSGTRAVSCLRVEPFIQDRRWLARSGAMLFDEHEIEEIPDGISINIDIRVEPPPRLDDEVSLAALTTQMRPPQMPVADNPIAVQQENQLDDEVDPDEVLSAASDDSMSSQEVRDADEDWRFVHVCLLGRRIFHGRLPWRQPHTVMDHASRLTGVPADDLVHLHFVRFGPHDLQAARVAPLIAQVYSDLPIGSVHRLVLLDIEFHEHPPAHEVSTSRRCIAVPRVLTRTALLRLTGLSVYCQKTHDRCLIWHNREPIGAQFVAPFDVEHGDYLRIAVPPLPRAPVTISTRACVSRARQQPRRMNYATIVSHNTHDHEDGMSVVDSYVDENRPLALYDDADDRSSLLQHTAFPSSDIPVEAVLTCKVDDDHAEVRHEISRIGLRNDRALGLQHDMPPIIHELYVFFFQVLLAQRGQLPSEFVVETWYSDHERRPHSGLGREVRLTSDFSTWFRDLVMAWEDWIDPFHALHWAIVEPTPTTGNPDVHLHLIIVQHAWYAHRSVLTTVFDPDDDPWHPRVLCFRVPTPLSHALLQGFVDLDGRCELQNHRCQTWRGDHDLTALADFDIEHGAGLTFVIERTMASLASFASSSIDASAADDRDPAISTQLLQTHKKLDRVQIALQQLVPAPQRTLVDCQKVIFLRNQLLMMEPIQPELHVNDIWWHPATWAHLSLLPPWQGESIVGITMYTDGSACRKHLTAAAGVVLLIHTDVGLRWGGYISAICRSTPTAPYAEASALFLALLWLHHLLRGLPPGAVWCEIAFDCENTAMVAQGLQTPSSNLELHQCVRSLVQWFEVAYHASLTWTHHRSHRQHPWNEAADTVCRHAQQSGTGTLLLEPLLHLCTFQLQDTCPVQWLWLLEKSLKGHPDAPLLCGHLWSFDVSAPFQSVPDASLHPALQRQREADFTQADRQHFSFRFATANVLTLYPDSACGSGYVSARAEELAQQFVDSHVHIIGLQETRARFQGHRHTDVFHILSAPATAHGHGGVQLWIRKRLVYQQLTIDLDVHDLRILHASSRRLLVRLAHPSVRLLILVVHAPTDEDETILQTFWDATTAAIPTQYRTWNLIVLADANSRLGSIASSAVEALHSDEENLKGAWFHSWLLQHQLFLPQTFADCHSGPGATWTHPKGSSARIDFIAVSVNFPLSAVRTWVEDAVDLTLTREDHKCVCLELDLPFVPVDRRRRFDRVRRVAPADTDFIPWDLDVHTHAAHLHGWLLHQQVTPRIWRKQHLSDDTKKLIDAKKFHRQRLRVCQNHLRLACLRQLFAGWRQHDVVVSDLRPWLRHCDHAIAWHQWAYSDLAARVVKAVREDDQLFYDGLAARAGDESTKGCQALWSAIKHALPRWRNKQRANLRCMGPSIWEQLCHYDQLEAGSPIDYTTLVQRCHQAQKEASCHLPLTVPLADVPSRCQVELLGCNVKSRRAPGIDSVFPETVKLACSKNSVPFHNLILKVWLLGAEPVQYKGGLVHAISKKEGGQRIDQMRGITLIDIVGKMIHSLLRQKFLPGLNQLRQPLQLGGFARKTTLFATQYVRAFASFTAMRHMSSAILFIDIRSAFHMMIREFIFDTTKVIPDKLATVLTAAGFNLDTIRGNVARRTTFTEHHVSQSVAHLLADAHDHTWYTLGACDVIHRTERGSRPGSPLADVAYNSLMALVIQELQFAFDSHPPLQHAFALLGLAAPIVAWVDDLAVPLVASAAEDMVPILQWVAETTVRICGTFGLQINFNPKKTETVLAFRGSGAPGCRDQWMVRAQGCIPLPGVSSTLRCVPQYEHLGTTFQADGGISAEIRHRCARAAQAYRQVRKPILLNRHVAVVTRIRLFEALVMPVLLHGAGNWPLLTSSQLHSLHAFYLRCLRSIIGDGFWAMDQRSDMHLLLTWSLPTISMRLAKARLLHGFHLVRDAPVVVIDFVTAVHAQPLSWVQGVRQAIAWYTSLSPEFFAGDPMTVPCTDIVHWLAACGVQGPRDARRLFRYALAHGKVVGDALSHHLELQRCLRKGGLQFPDAQPPPPAVHSFACRWCSKSFDTARKLRAHQWCAHGEPSDERRFMSSTICPACWTQLWTSNRLQIHLRLSRHQRGGCYEQLTWRYDPFDAVQEIVDTPADQYFSRLPAYVVPHVSSARDHQRASREDALACFAEEWNREGLPDAFDDVQGAAFFAAFDATIHAPVPGAACDLDALLWQMSSIADSVDQPHLDARFGAWALWRWTMDHFSFVNFPHLGLAGFDRIFRALRDMVVVSPVGRLLCWQRRMDEAYCPWDASNHRDELADDVLPSQSSPSCLEPVPSICTLQDTLFAPLFTQQFMGNSCVGVPLCSFEGKTVLVILHLFSGRRRSGDCHWWMDRLAMTVLPDYPILLLSVDTAVDGALGDLSTGPNLRMLLQMAARGAVAGSLTGPPCETFSAARNLQLEEENAPRPLRTRALPWCLPHRTMRELRQCSTGTELLFNSLMLESTIALAGGGCLMEHPEEPRDEDKVSVWRLQCHESWLMKLRGAARHHIEQWLFGASGVKPTCIRALGLGPPALVGRVFQNNTEPWRAKPLRGLKGRDDAGRFRTAKAKEYPSSLCRTLVLAMLHGLKSRIRSEGVRTPVQLSAIEQTWVNRILERAQDLSRFLNAAE